MAKVGWEALSVAIHANPTNNYTVQHIPVIPLETQVSWMPDGWSEEVTPHSIDTPVALSLWMKDPLYRIATTPVRYAMESDETLALQMSIESAWKRFNGKERGWVRKHIEEGLHEKHSGSFWESVLTQKRIAHLLDFICCVRGLRVAIWFPSSSKVTVIPFTNPSSPSPSSPSPSSPSIIQFNADTGKLLLNSKGYVEPDRWQSLYLSVKDFNWVPPMSAPSIGTHTITQIQSQLKLLSSLSDKKENRTTLWNRLMWLTFIGSMMSNATLVSDE
jgi:hypothetical protein